MCGLTHMYAYARPPAAIVLLQVDASHVTSVENTARSVCFIHYICLYASAHARLHECARVIPGAPCLSYRHNAFCHGTHCLCAHEDGCVCDRDTACARTHACTYEPAHSRMLMWTFIHTPSHVRALDFMQGRKLSTLPMVSTPVRGAMQYYNYYNND